MLFLLGSKCMSLYQGTRYGWKAGSHDTLGPQWKKSVYCYLSTPTPVSYRHCPLDPSHQAKKKAYHADPGRLPSGPPRGTSLTHRKPRSFWRGRRKRGLGRARSKIELGKRLLLLGLTSTVLNLTTVPAQGVFISCEHSYDFRSSSTVGNVELRPVRNGRTP